MPIAKLILDARDVKVVEAAIRRITIEQNVVGAGKEARAQAKRLMKVKFRTEPVVVADTLQQMKGDNLIYLPVLYVDEVLTTIDGQKAGPVNKKERLIAERHARVLRQNLRDKW
jgi:FlaA1/EpsC-like NDP-sugar epimerase